MDLCFFISHLFDVGFLMSLFEERFHLIHAEPIQTSYFIFYFLYGVLSKDVMF